jgi:hypothetical protein
MSFSKWINTLIDEKGIDREQVLKVEGPSGVNSIPVGCIVDMMIGAPAKEQQGIKAMLVKIEFHNGDVVDYFRHLAQAVAR